MKENTTPTVSDIFQTLFKENKSQFTENFNKIVSEKVTASFVYDFISITNESLNLKYCKVNIQFQFLIGKEKNEQLRKKFVRTKSVSIPHR